MFTHGVEIGIARNESHDLQTATDELIASLQQGNPASVARPATTACRIAGRPGLKTVLSNMSEVTGQRETIEIYTTQMRDGNVFYAIAVAPQNQVLVHRNIFDRVVGSIQLAQ